MAEAVSVQLLRAVAENRDADIGPLLDNLGCGDLLATADNIGFAADCMQHRLGRGEPVTANTTGVSVSVVEPNLIYIGPALKTPLN